MIRNSDCTKLIAGSLIRMNKKAKPAFFVASVLLIAVIGLIFSREIPRIAASVQGNSIGVVSAASFDSTLAPESIAAVFGVDLATDFRVVNTLPLPTELLGTSVAVRDSAGTERLAFLFFISPGQINCLIPAGTAEGVATVTVRSGKGNTETGTAMISKAAPAILTANASGVGAPAAVALRIRSNGSFGFEGILQGAFPNIAPAAIDLGPEGERVFLVLYLCGLRFVPKADVRVLLGGSEIPSEAFLYSPSDFIGVDQLNVELSRSLIGRGRLKLSVSAQGRVSNQIEFEVGGRIVSEAPQITAVSKTADVLAGEEIVLTGARFAANAKDNTVRFGTRPATVVSASTGQLRIRVPYGAESDQVSVITPQGEGRSSQTLTLRTTISGFVKDTHNAPIPGVKVTMGNNNRTVLTNSEGLFFLNEVPANTRTAFLQFDGRAVTGALFPDPPIKYNISANRDNLVETPVFLLQVNGAQTQVGSALTGSPETDEEITLMTAAPDQTGVGELKFIVPAGTTIRFPNGATSGTLTLNAEPNGLTPVALPPDNFVSVIAQIAFFGATLNPGGRLIFPNPENLPPGTTARLYRYDVNSADNSPWVDTKDAVTVFADRIETSVNAVKQTSYYFVAAERPVTTAIGRVIEDNGAPEGRPVAGATVRIRGRETLTDGNGGFVLRNVGVNGDGRIFADVNLLRANGQVDSKQSASVLATLNGLTNLGAIVLATDAVPNRPPTALIPASITVNAGEQFDQPFTASDPDPGQSVSLQISDTRFAEIISRGGNAYTLRLKPTLSDANTTIKLTLTVTDNLGKLQSFDIAVIVRPVCSYSIAPNSQSFTATGGTGSVAVTAPNGCAWTTSSNVTWLVITAGASGSGNGTVSYSVAASASTSSRTGSLTIAGRLFTVTQSGANPAPTLTSLNPSSATAGGAAFTLTINGSNFVNGSIVRWNGSDRVTTFVSSTQLRAQIPASDIITAGVAVVTVFNPAPGGGTSNAAAFTIGQSCSYAIQPTNQSFNATGGVGSVIVTTASGCAWTATSNASWITIISGTVGNGSGSVSYSVGANTSASQRIGTMTIGGQMFMVTQTGNNCVTTSLTLEQTVSGSLSSSDCLSPIRISEGIPTYADRYSFTATAGQQIAITLTSSAFDTYLYLIGPNGNVVTEDDDGGGNGNSRIPSSSGLLTLSATGSYIIEATSYSRGSIGNYTLSTTSGSELQWRQTGLSTNFITALATNGATVFAGDYRNGVYRSTDDGQNWTPVNDGLTVKDIQVLRVSGTTLFAGTFSGLYLSADNGQNWMLANDDFLHLDFRSIAVSGSTILAGTRGIVYRSVDTGQNWMAINNGLANSPVQALAVIGNIFLAGTFDRGLYRSTNNGQNWTAANNGLPSSNIWSLAVSGETFFLGNGGGVYRSTDNGQNWISASNGLPSGAVLTLLIQEMTIFAGVNGGGVYRSIDGGQNWTAINSGLTDLRIYALAMTGTKLFAGTLGSGVFVLDLAGNP